MMTRVYLRGRTGLSSNQEDVSIPARDSMDADIEHNVNKEK